MEVDIGDVNKVTHSYTAQYSLTASGKLIPQVFLCLQKPSGKFGPQIQQKIQKLCKHYGNTFITCSKSGKLSSVLFQLYITMF